MTDQTQAFYDAILAGLQSPQKQLPSKYFYDAEGDRLFQQIMGAPEYYLTNCDFEIFSRQAADMAKVLVNGDQHFDILELGAGDAVKSTQLLKSLAGAGKDFTYRPIDISAHIIELLCDEMPSRIPGIKIDGLTGEYLQMLRQAYRESDRKKLLLFLGSSIGNFEVAAAREFLKAIHAIMKPRDLILVGFDLKKDPFQILAAYNDAAGFTRAFNLNLLTRINRELGADFDTDAFLHFPTYNPETGACRSFLVSRIAQTVRIPGAQPILFEAHEAINMELSQKFSITAINDLAKDLGFAPEPYFYDEKRWYCNAIWRRI